MRRLVPFLVLLVGCTPKPEIVSVPPGPPSGAATPSPISDSSRFFTTIVERVPAPPNPKSIDQLEGDASARPDDPKALKALGLGYYNAGGFLPAGTTLERARKVSPADAEAALFLGLSQLGQGETKNAVETLTKVASASSPSIAARARFALGDVAYADKKDAEAAASYARALKLDPTLGVAALALGALRAEAGKMAEAKTLFLSAVKGCPPGSLRSRAYASLGRLAMEAKDTAGAKSWATKALTEDPTNPWAKQIAR